MTPEMFKVHQNMFQGGSETGKKPPPMTTTAKITVILMNPSTAILVNPSTISSIAA